MSKEPLPFLTGAIRNYGPVVGLRIARTPALLVSRPEHYQRVFNDNARNYVRGFVYRLMEKVVGSNMVTSEGSRWRKVRRIAQPAFKRSNVEALDQVVTDAANAQIARWDDLAGTGQTVNIDEEMTVITFSVIGQMLFTLDMVAEVPECAEAINTLLKHFDGRMSNPLHLPSVIPTPDNIRARRARQIFDDLITRCIAKQEEEDSPKNLLGLLMQAKDPETGEGLPRDILYNEILALVFAGHETTTLALTWTLYLLARHPEVHGKLMEELDGVLEGRTPNASDMDKLPYLSAILHESLRLYPPFWILSREALAEDFIEGYRVTKGTQVILSPWVMHRNPDVWERPDVFDPTRFLGDAPADRHRLSWLPFGAGPHKCIGMGLAMMELHLILPLILGRFHLDLDPDFEVEYDTRLSLRPANGMPMRITHRT